MKVVLSGYYGFHNVGDEAILQSIIGALQEADPSISITVLSNDPNWTKKTYGVDTVNRWSLKEISNAIRQSDGFISGGGSLLQDKTGFRSVPYYAGLMLLTRFLKKPFFVYAQGIGPVDQQINKMLVKFALSKAQYLSVRDEASKDLLQSLGIKKDIKIVPDPVIGFQVKKTNRSSSLITVAIRDWPTEAPYRLKLARALDQFISDGYDAALVPMHGEHDYKSAQQLLEHMNEKAEIFRYDASIEEKIEFISESALMVGMRLHALIFAAISSTPMIGLSYDPKIDAFLQQVDQPLIGEVDDNWTSDELIDLMKHQLERNEEEQEKLSAIVGEMRTKANETAKDVIQLLR